jgi:hypothetical protein
MTDLQTARLILLAAGVILVLGTLLLRRRR